MRTWATELESLSTQYQAAIRFWHYAATLEERTTAAERAKDSLTRLATFFDEYSA
jgi:hypothetical protein